MEKERLLEQIENYNPIASHNLMGCSDNWYVFAYAMKNAFSIEEIKKMSQHEIDLLYKLHDAVAEGLY